MDIIEKNNEAHILLYSGGIDSYVAYYYLQNNLPEEKIIPIFINMHHKYSSIELQYIRKYRPETIVIDFPSYGDLFEKYDAYIPNRNLLMALLAVSYFEESYDAFNIYLGGLKDDRILDNNVTAFKHFSKALTISIGKKVYLKSAFDFKLSKNEVVDWYYMFKHKDDPELYDCAFSCYNPITNKQDPHCYSCKACFRRNVSLFNYIKLQFNNLILINDYFEDIRKNKENYEKQRYIQTQKYLKWTMGLS